MKNRLPWIATIVTMLLFALIGVSSMMGPVQSQDADEETEGRSEHQTEDNEDEGESGEGGSDSGGEEDGTALAPNEIYDELRRGARLILAFDAASNSFVGTVENTTDDILRQVRVEVHLSNGLELGPTIPIDLAPGEQAEVVLSVFDSWSAHAEVGVSESNHEADNAGGGEGGERSAQGEHGDSKGDGD